MKRVFLDRSSRVFIARIFLFLISFPFHNVVYGVSQIRSPFDFVRLCKLACSMRFRGRHPVAVGCSGRFDCPCSQCRHSSGSSSTTSSYGSPNIYINVGSDQPARHAMVPHAFGPTAVMPGFPVATPTTATMGTLTTPLSKVIPPSPRGGVLRDALAIEGRIDPCRSCGSSACAGTCQMSNLCCWNLGPIGVGYFRFASQSHSCFEGGAGSKFGNLFQATTSERGSLAPLWFGKEDFTVEEMSADGFLSPEDLGEQYNPFLVISLMSPRFEYRETGFFFGGHFQFKSGCFRAGAFIGVPFKDVRITLTSFNETGLEDVIADPTLDAVLTTCAVVPPLCDPSADNSDFAYRLDFLREDIRYGGPTSGIPTYIIHPTAGNIDMTGSTPDNSPVFLIKREDGTVPARVPLGDGVNPGISTYGKTSDQVNGQLSADGSGTDDLVYHFASSTAIDYHDNLGMDRDAQRTLWLVPCYTANASGDPVYCEERTRRIREAVRNLLIEATTEESATEFLCRVAGINMREDDIVSGFGDTLARFYAGYCSECFNLCVFTEFTLPSGKRQEETRRVYFLSPGNNGHWAAKLGLEASFTLFGCLTFSSDISFDSTLPAIEVKPAPFTGAVAKGVSTQTDASVGWSSLLIHADLGLNVGGFGFDIGYEGFSKGDDSVDFSTGDMATDFFDREKPLDARILEECTATVSHKFRGDFFYSSGTGKFFAGSSVIFAGRNAMHEIEIFLGFAATF